MEYIDDTRTIDEILSFRIGDEIEVLHGNLKNCVGRVSKVTKIQMEVEWISGKHKPLEEAVAGTKSRINQSNARLLRRATPPPIRVLPDYNEGHYLSQCIAYRNRIHENAVQIRDDMTSLVNMLEHLDIVDAQRVAQIHRSVQGLQGTVSNSDGSNSGHFASRRTHRRRRR